MLKYPCLVLDHDDTVVQSEQTVNFPYFQYILNEFRPGTTVTLQEYTEGCCYLGFADMCRKWYSFSEQELIDEYEGWKEYIRSHIPEPYAGIDRILHRQIAAGGKIFVVSHSCTENITRDYLTHFGLEPEEIFGWDLPEEHRKPNPYPLQEIMRRYGYRPEEMLVVDDMKPAYEMASKVSAPIAFAAWGRKDYPDIVSDMKKICNYTFYSPQELEHFLFDDLTDML